ncbi:MAG: hypothetical protein K1X36_09685 [Pyrinomonadaceae bacterium]|nr:hypothetical protein [Pyrinomonadaceae bacterium]
MKIRIVACHAFIMLMVSAVTAISQHPASTTENFNGAADLSWNDQMVLNSMRFIHSAEMAHRNTFGNGSYATLQALQQADLVDAGLASGQKYGYRFTLTVRFATATMQPGFELTASPLVRRARYLSFYLNEACDIRGAEKAGRDATISDPIIQACGTSLTTENESYARGSLRTIHSAQMTYLSTYGAGQYGTPAQLFNTDLVTTGFVLSYIWRGYSASFSVTAPTSAAPARFTVGIVPTIYGRTGKYSYFIDETGVLRGGDKNGGPADQNDPPVADQ